MQIPILTVGEELPQILLDIRSSRAFKWKSAILLYDDIFGNLAENQLKILPIYILLYTEVKYTLYKLIFILSMQ